MARRSWSEEDKAAILRLWKVGCSYVEIADVFGVTRQAISLTVRRHNLIPAEEASASVHERSRGRPKSAAHKRALAKMQRSKWTPERRAKASERLTAHRATETGREEVQRALQVVARNKRGFDLPDHLRDEYRFLRRSKKIPAREAGAILGLIPLATGGR